MGIGSRIFLVDDDDSIQRLSLARYERLLRRDPAERLPQYADRRVRYAMAILEMQNRKPAEIMGIQYSFLRFDGEGRIDAAEQEREARLAVEVLPPLTEEPQSSRVVNARHRFAKRQFEDKYKWTPSSEIVAAIVEAIFAKRLD